MKKTMISSVLFIIVLFICAQVKAQSSRLQLFEYFDNIAVGTDGATDNAHFDSLADANSGNVTFIKYHAYYIGTDVMNFQDSAQVRTRVGYYNDFAIPWAYQDGGVSTDATFNAQPLSLTQANIDHRNLTTSPFTIGVSHTFNATNDTIKCHVVIRKTGTAPAALTAHVVVIEKLIRFTIPPGSSGDNEFRNVVKQMLPADTGSWLPAMAIGDSFVLNLNWKLANVYNNSQLAIVSFVQGRDSTNREVYQAGYSAPIPQANDAGVISITSAQYACDSIVPVVLLQNAGTASLTSCNINYKIGAGFPVTVPWTGNIAPGASLNVTMPAIYNFGPNALLVYTTDPNSNTDNNHANDSSITNFVIGSPTPVAIPVAQGFEYSWPPAAWILTSTNNSYSWQQDTVGGFGASAKSAELDWFVIGAGVINDLVPPVIDLSTSLGTPAITFNIAYARYKPGYNDTFQVRVSADCGATWDILYSKSGLVLATALDDSLGIFVPTADEWRWEAIDISAYNGQPRVQIQFHGISGFGNNLYLDDVNIYDNERVAQVNAVNNVSIYPNPVNNLLTITATNKITGITITNPLGQTVYMQTGAGGSMQVDVSGIPAGVYFIKINNTVVRKFVKE